MPWKIVVPGERHLLPIFSKAIIAFVMRRSLHVGRIYSPSFNALYFESSVALDP